MEPDTLKSVAFIQKDSKRFAETRGWGLRRGEARGFARLARPSRARSVELGRQLPVEPRAERATHDELLVLRGQPRQLFREHRHALLPRDRHARDVRAPEHAL